jgi:hypothetical protein
LNGTGNNYFFFNSFRFDVAIKGLGISPKKEEEAFIFVLTGLIGCVAFYRVAFHERM